MGGVRIGYQAFYPSEPMCKVSYFESLCAVLEIISPAEEIECSMACRVPFPSGRYCHLDYRGDLEFEHLRYV